MREPYDPQAAVIDVDTLTEARRRYMRAGYSALFRCVEDPSIGMRRFLEVADSTQRELVGKVAVEYYSRELGMTEDNLATFFGITNVGVVGSGFDYEVNRWDRPTSVSAEQYRCPLIDHATAAGYPIGHRVYDDMSLWCDTYDNFESAAVTPSVAMAHSHCLGRGDHQCRWFIEKIEPERRRKDDEHIFDYLARMRDEYRATTPGDGGPWVIDGLDPAEIDRITRENVGVSEADQDKLFPTPEEKLTQGVLVSARIAGSSIGIAARLMGWDRLIAGMAEKEGAVLTAEARRKANSLGIYGTTAKAAADLHRALNVAMGGGEIRFTEESTERVVGEWESFPLGEALLEAGLADQLGGFKDYLTAAATYECAALGPGISFEFTECTASENGSTCKFVIESSPVAAAATPVVAVSDAN